MIDRKRLEALEDLQPSSPEEYLEAARRFVEICFECWDHLPDGDGEPSEGDEIVTRSDLFAVIGGCAGGALDCIRMKNAINSI